MTDPRLGTGVDVGEGLVGSGLTSLGLQSGSQVAKRKGVDHVALGEPALPGDAGAQAQETEVFQAVGVAVELALDN
jgi:hypothetical protein